MDIKKELHYKSWSVPNNGGLASHWHEKLCTLGANVDKRREGTDRGEEGKND